MWMLENLQIDNAWRRPSFFVWVEPYLAGGHCIYLSPQGKLSLNDMFPKNIYRYNTLAKGMHDQHDFSKREAGCQTTFIPYGRENLQRFLAALFPKIIQIIESGNAKSQILSWCGDKDTLVSMGLGLSECVNDIESFTLVQRSI